ncbi:hypothetical protein PHAVU_010G031600 [Phaseolus vulgaris]|uniref:Sacsin/Nov domain-containing protein n=1 Tax=Phaseolus vulgaris TaxID=3885 RepID=V7ANT6_PHAVU|nr:hypothetical protein PHAVU_010G031600g [Phaseolus vulgaris]ESW06248.1 hypothetical protein PHAVU_010G031600g [Phaseolus vulgaris]
MVTPKEHIEEIRKNKFSIGKDPNPLIEDLHQAVKNLSVELYTKDVHFLMELIQNAEDNLYSKGVKPSLEFIITSKDITATGAPATLLIFNNEKGFSPKNIESVCSVGRSTKKGNRSSGYIGEKGIGFKSVFLVTTQPYIFSNGYQIRFNEKPCPQCGLGYIVPEWIEEKPTLQDIKKIYGGGVDLLPTTTIVLPLKPDKVTPVKLQLSNFHPEVLLFLAKIRHLSECSYYMWKQKFPVRLENVVERRKDVEEWVVTLAFPHQDRLNRGMSSSGVYAFLPTEMVTNFPFIIQADFVLASSRETILMDDKWNRGILKCVPTAFVDSFKTLILGSDQAPVSTLANMFKFIPIRSSPYEKLNYVREKIKEKLLEENIIPIETYKKQKHFCKSHEVGRLLPEFWNVLNDAQAEGIQLDNLSYGKRKILSSALDMSQYDGILEFLGVEHVKARWYAKCIQSSNFVDRLSEKLYLKLLLFIATNWDSFFGESNMTDIPLLKYLAVIYANFLYHSFSKNYISSFEVDALCESMPIVDKYGNVNESRNKVLVPARVSNWAKLMVSNPWVNQNYVEMGEVYLNRSTYAGQSTDHQKLIEFMTDHLGASDIPDLYPPNAGFSAADTRLTKENAFLFLRWIKNQNSKLGGIPQRFLECIKNGSWLKVTVNGWMPPSKSFLIESSLGKTLESCSSLVDIPLVDETFYGSRIHHYKKELQTVGVMLSYEEACEFIGKELMHRAENYNLSRNRVILMLEFIKCQRERVLPLDKFVNSIKKGKWLKTSLGLRSPKGSVLYDEEWKIASQISAIRFIDRTYFGKEIYNFKEELMLLGVIVGFSRNYQVVIDHLKLPSNFASLNAEAFLLLMECVKFSSASVELVNSIKTASCLKTNMGFKVPGDCFLSDPVWGCILEVFGGLPVIDKKFFGERIFSYKGELKQIGVVVDFEEAIKEFVGQFKQKASDDSFSQQHVKSFLSCHRLLKGTEYKFPADLLATVRSEKWLLTRIGGYSVPRDCILDGVSWKSISSITCLPFIDDSDNCYGTEIHEYKEELKSFGVVTELKDRVKFVLKYLNFPSDPSSIAPESVFSFLECIRLLLKGAVSPHDEAFRKRLSTNWLKTHDGYRSPDQCVLFDSKWESAKWVHAKECVIHDTDNLFASKFYVLEDIYDKKILPFFSLKMEVRTKPSVDDYVNLWNEWESSVEQLSYDKCHKFWLFMLHHFTLHTEKKLSERFLKLPATSGNNDIFLLEKKDVFIPDNLHLKRLFEMEKVFVWYPQNLVPSSRNDLSDLYRKIGARSVSECICTEYPSLPNVVELKQIDAANVCNVKVLVKLILGFLACSSLKMEPNKRHEAVKGLLNLSFFEIKDSINGKQNGSLGESKFNVFTQMNWHGENAGLVKYATYFSEAISEGVLMENHDHVALLSELIRLAFLLKFNEEAIDFLMDSKNLQIFCEDDDFLSSVFGSTSIYVTIYLFYYF